MIVDRLPSSRSLGRAAIVLAAFALGVGVVTPLVADEGTGVHLGINDGRVVVWTVDPFSIGAKAGIRTGMVVVRLNDRPLWRLPQATFPEPAAATPDPITGEVPAVPMPTPVLDPVVPTQVPYDEASLQAFVTDPVRYVEAMAPGDLAAWSPREEPAIAIVSVAQWGRPLTASLGYVVVGIAILFAAGFWVSTGRAGPSLRELGLPLALATASPFLLDPFTRLWNPVATVVGALLVPLALVPLALALVARVETRQERLLALSAVAVCGAGALVMGAVARLAGDDAAQLPAKLLTAGITLAPGLIAAGPLLPRSAPASGGRLMRAAELAIAGITPGLAVLTVDSSYLIVLVAWVAVIALAGRFTIRPLARLASRAQLQRDLVVAATEAERARVAAEIHDDALQELTLLVRRLDAGGDAEGAEIARNVSDRLRAICGDLRLPILDDLGVGPALDWLVERIERLAGGEVRLERADGARLPTDVELAFFRVAQEALANAVKHGAPPIVVRYRSAEGIASLSVDDSGAGIGPQASEQAVADGRYGLFGMQQRAEAIGAILDVRRWPSGGTHVALEWRAG